MCIIDDKTALRQIAKKRRLSVADSAGPAAAEQLADHLAERFSLLEGQVVSGYLQIGSEIDVVPALSRLKNSGLEIVLPVIVGRDRPLCFRRWTDEIELEFGPFQTRQPPTTSPEMIPDLLIVPMLAFDSEGYRIGWGGGFYDRTILKLRAVKPIIAVGAAYSGQQVDKVPRDAHDARLNLIATEIGITEIALS